jgi:hypothetical protein
LSFYRYPERVLLNAGQWLLRECEAGKEEGEDEGDFFKAAKS